MLGIVANDHDAALALDHLALLAHRLNGRSYFHLKLPPCHEAFSRKKLLPLTLDLFGTPGDAALLQVVRGHLHRHLITGKDSDEVHSQLAGDVG